MRLIRNAFCTISLLACLAFVGAWVYSVVGPRFHFGWILYDPAARKQWQLNVWALRGGPIVFVGRSHWPSMTAEEWARYTTTWSDPWRRERPVHEGWLRWYCRPLPMPTRRVIGFDWEHSSDANSPLTGIGLPTHDLWQVTVPYWSLVLATGVAPARVLYAAGRRRRRARRGLCARCGYDLRGSPERCPECGTPAALAHD